MTAGSTEAPAPISVAQEALWYLHLLAPNGIGYNETVSIRKHGSFDPDAFAVAFNALVARHEAWRTTFEVRSGTPVQIVHPPEPVQLPLPDLGRLDPEAAERRAVEEVARMAKVPYDLRRGPLVRPLLVRFPGAEHRLYLGLHHIVFDGVSLYRIVLPELVALYDAAASGDDAALGDQPAHYGDYARDEQEWIEGPRARRRMARAAERLGGTPVASLPLDFSRRESPGFRGAAVAISLDAQLVERLKGIARGAGATLFQVLGAAWSVLLARSGGRDDVAFGTAADLRRRPEFESVVGYSLTPVVLRVALGGRPSFRELIGRVRNETLDALDTLVPFERLVRELQPKAPPGANPLYQTIVIFEPTMPSPDPAWSLQLMEVELADAVGGCRLDLELQLDERPDGHIAGRLLYDRELFERASAQRIAGHFARVLDALAADPDADALGVSITTEADRRWLRDRHAASIRWAPATVHGLIEERAGTRPDARAVSFGAESISYATLCQRAEGVARGLRANGVGEGAVVALPATPSIELVVTALGVLRAGAAHLLIDPGLPSEALGRVVAASGAVLLDPTVACRSSPEARGAPAAGREGARCCLVHASDPDGPPRVAGMSHGAVLDMARTFALELGIGPNHATAVLAHALHATAALDLWMPLISGARIVLAPEALSFDGANLSRLIASERIAVLHASPETWRSLLASGLRAARGVSVLCDAPLDEELADELSDRYRLVFHTLRAHPSGLYAALGRIERGRPITIGAPIAHARIDVLDEDGRPVPPGLVGRLVVTAEGLEPSVQGGDAPDSAGSSVERTSLDTGALARWRSGGELELVPTLGRER